MKSVLWAALLLLLFRSVGTSAQYRRVAKPEWFDVPVNNKTLDFGPSWEKPSDTAPAWQWNAYRGARNKLSCYWFPSVMVKEYDISQKGAAWISFIRVAASERPECTRSHVPGEKVLANGGYFYGVKKDFVFLTDADGDDGGIGFYVYDSRTSKKIFEDTDCLTCMYLDKMYGKQPLIAPFDRMRISETPDGAITLVYMRAKHADCDLRANSASCWDHVKIQMGVENAKKPECLGYEADTPVGGTPSMVAHPVFVSLESPPIVNTVDGPLLCWGPD